jgi:hypothetical protein
LALKTTLGQLEEVQAAITAVMTGQAYTIGGRTLTRADLTALQKREENLLARYRSEQEDQTAGCRRVYTTPVGDTW